MNCLTCARTMTLLFTSAVCDHCNPPKIQGRTLTDTLTGLPEKSPSAEKTYTYYVILDNDIADDIKNNPVGRHTSYLDIFDNKKDAILDAWNSDESVFELHCKHEITPDQLNANGCVGFECVFAFDTNYIVHKIHENKVIHVMTLGEKVYTKP